MTHWFNSIICNHHDDEDDDDDDGSECMAKENVTWGRIDDVQFPWSP